MNSIYPQGLLDKVNSAPVQPGCYLYFDKMGNIIYVGKAKHLRNRVKSYFTKAALEDERLEDLLPRIEDVEFRVVPSELDALILEYHLIKQHKPWFNSAMKADKQRPFLRIAHGDTYPSMSIARERQDDGAAYYDCFTDDFEIKATLGLLAGVWHTAQCGKASFEKPQSPCIYHSMKVCLAPCAYLADSTAYTAAVQEIQALLSGAGIQKLAELENEMERCASALEFERAAQCKQKLDGLAKLKHKGAKMYHFPSKGTVLVLIRPFREKPFSAFYVRGAEVMNRVDFLGLPDASTVAEMLKTSRAIKEPVDGSKMLSRCLTDISAQKKFIVLGARTTGQQVYKAIRAFV